MLFNHCICDNDDQDDTLRPEFGIHFRNIGKLEPVSDRYYATADITLPELTIADRNSLSSITVDCPSGGSPAVSDICNSFKPVFIDTRDEALKLHDMASAKITIIKTLLPQYHTSTRKKKFIPLVAGAITAIASATNSFIQYRRDKTMSKTMSIMAARQYHMEHKYLDLTNDFSTLAKITSSGMNNITKGLRQTNNKLAHLSLFVTRLCATFNNSMPIVLSTVRINSLKTNFLTVMTTRALKVSSQHIRYYQQLNDHLDDLLDCINMLMQGQLPFGLIPPNELQDLFDHVQDTLLVTAPEFELVNTHIASIYHQTDISYTNHGNHLYVQIPFFLRARHLAQLTLHSIDITYVPFDLTGRTNKNSYTKVNVESHYIGVTSEHYVLLSDKQLQQCTVSNNLYECSDTILHIHRSKHSCVSAIYWRENIDLIKAVCRFDYYHNITVSPKVMDAGKKLLLSGLSTPWSIICNDNSIPITHSGSSYTVIKRESLCRCAISSAVHYISAKTTNCNSKLDKLKLLYPVNAAVFAYFRPKTDTYLDNVTTLLSTITPNPDLPNFHFVDHSKDEMDTLIHDDPGTPVNLDILATLANKANSEVYLSNHDRIEAIYEENWFANNIGISGFTLFLSILGVLSLLISIFYLYKTYSKKLSTIFTYKNKNKNTNDIESQNNTDTGKESTVQKADFSSQFD